MQIGILDFLIIAAYFIFVTLIGVKYSGRAGQSIEEFFVSGRSLPWWLAGTSMVATTFAADTPLAVTGLVAEHGIAGNWLWWNMVMSGMLTVFFYARLWHRAGILTDVEFAEIRYGGKPAAFLRGFRALYLALPINSIIMGWVTLAMAKIIGTATGMEKWPAVLICVGVTLIYSLMSGLWGVVVTDFFQFFIAITGAVILAVFAVNFAGGFDVLVEKLSASEMGGGEILAFFPEIGSAWMPVTAVAVYLALNWWATWYPGAEPGGGGYIAQRIFSAKDEKNGIFATLWFNIAHYTIRPWPWIIVALATLVVYPGLGDKESGYVLMIVDALPPGLRGLLLASFAAAFMSTISTQLNWGSSYLINDFYKRFIKKNGTASHYVYASRAATVLIVVIAAFTTMMLDTISGAWKFLMAIGAGTGLVYILRWYWWRINAWSEISAMTASFIISILLQTGFGFSSDDPKQFSLLMIITVTGSTFIWLLVTFLTKPEDESILVSFYKRVKPAGRLWKKIYSKYQLEISSDSIGLSLRSWFIGIVLIYCFLFAVGHFLFGSFPVSVILFIISLACMALLWRELKRL